LIREVNIEELAADATTLLTLPSIVSLLFLLLLRTTCLRAFSMSSTTDIPIGVAHMRCLSQVCSATLTRLSLVLRFDADGVLSVMNTLTSLNTLHLRFRDGASWTHSLEHPLNLPAVQDVRWHCEFHPLDQDPMLAFLARCTFGSACRIDLSLAFLRPAGAALLLPLFSAHVFAEAKVYMPPESVTALSTGLMRARVVNFLFFVPPTAVLCAGVLPAVIKIGYAPTQRSESQLWAFLNALSLVPLTGKTVFLRMTFFRGVFEWGGPCEGRYKAFVQRLNPLALASLKRGIIILDEGGRDASGGTHSPRI
jgi:hypothetical protein